jgi:hypothetical protein
MKRWAFLSLGVTALLGIGAICFGGGGSSPGPAPNQYVRDAAPCACPGDCKCNHCGGSGARCYCQTGGCPCPAKKGACECKHCTGVPGGEDGKGNCACPK